MLIERFSVTGALLAVATLVASCSVGPDFNLPAAPDVDRYTKEPLAAGTSSTDAAFGTAQRFAKGKDVTATWWQLFRSPALNRLVEQSLQANPNLQSAIAALRAAKESVYAQQGHF